MVLASLLIPYFILGTAALIIRSTIQKCVYDCNTQTKEKLEISKKKLIQYHNGYLQKFKSIFTDQYVFEPFLFDEDLRKRKHQPDFIKSGYSQDQC